MHTTVTEVTRRISERSRNTRADYLQRMDTARHASVQREQLSCGNLAHACAAAEGDQDALKLTQSANIGIITAYNDMLSAHQPFKDYPDLIKDAARSMGCTAQVAGGVPAMCDGVTQGQDGMELSLFSRDTIALATAVSLSHNVFDGVLCLGVCDKIVPGLLIGALSFGHLPVIFVPAGPMPTGISNSEKARIRQLYAEGKIDRKALLEGESRSYHSAGTCTFYGTANSNQMLLEAMGVQLPGTAFVPPGTSLRRELTKAAAEQVCRITVLGGDYRPLSQVIDERAIVNAIVTLLATGGSTNHTLHLVAIARAAGIIINWNDFDQLSAVVPLLARIYPNGQADINQFQAAGGTSLVFRELIGLGLLHEDVMTVRGDGISAYCEEPVLTDGRLGWRPGPAQPLDSSVVATAAEPFAANGGLRVLNGNLGRGVIKVSAVKPQHRVIEAPAVVLQEQDQLEPLFRSGALDRDCVVVVRFQGPAANGMPELHKLTPFLGVLQDRGFKVALVTDGRMSGASGKVPAAIHVTPEAKNGGPLARVRDGDMIRLDANAGSLDVGLSADEINQRDLDTITGNHHQWGSGRELFELMRQRVSGSEQGACTLFGGDPEQEVKDEC